MLYALIQLLILLACTEPPAAAKPPAAAVVTFQKDVQPILSKRCQPCHFPGGSMHAKLPFDKPETVHTLGTRLFSRIKDEKEQTTIRAFLAQKSSS